MKSTNPRAARAAGLAVVLLAVALIIAWEHYAAGNKLPHLAEIVTNRIGDALKGERTAAAKPPAAVMVTPQVMTGGATRLPKPTSERPVEDKPVEQAKAPPVSAEPPVEAKPVEPAASIAGKQPDAERPAEPVVRAEPEQPRTDQKRAGMQQGAVVVDGRQAPALQVETMSADEIEGLVSDRKVFIVAENEKSGASFTFDDRERVFRPMREAPVALMSTRYLRVTEPGLVSLWSILLGRPTDTFRFGLRFSRQFDAAITERQFASLEARGVDFAKALADGTQITTHVKLDSRRDLEVMRVSIEAASLPIQ